MRLTKLQQLENHPTLFDLAPYTISIVRKVKRAAHKAVESAKEAVSKAKEAMKPKSDHPTLFSLKRFTISATTLKKMAQEKVEDALLAIAAKKKPTPYHPEGVRALAEAMLSDALYSLKALSKQVIPTRVEINELKGFFDGIGQMLAIAGIGDGDRTVKIANRILTQAEERLLQAAA